MDQPVKFRQRTEEEWAALHTNVLQVYLGLELIFEQHPKLKFEMVLPKIESFLDAAIPEFEEEKRQIEWIENCWKYCAKVCADLAHLNPEWSAVGGEVLLAWVKLRNPFTFSEYTKLGTSPKGISSEYSEFVQNNASVLDDWANITIKFEYPGACTLVQSYLYKIHHEDTYIRETPAMMYLRVATFLQYPDLPQIKELYDVLCEKKASFGSPVYFNAATRRPNLASCFAAGTRVMTQAGLVPIEAVKPGEYTLTHTGSWKKISQTHCNPRGDRLMVRLVMESNVGLPINCTQDHEFWAIKNYGKEREGSWIAAKDLGAGDYLHCPLNTVTRLGYTTPSGQNFVRIITKVFHPSYQPEVVYTLGVEEDHSYCVEGVTAKNCFLSRVQDSMSGISENWKEAALISMNKGGFGIDLTCLRHSEIGINGGVSRGILPWAKILNEIMNAVDQGSVRKGSATVFMNVFHVDIFEFIELRKAAGHESMRARDLFLCCVIPDLFWERVKSDGVWSMFCPNKCTGLATTWGKEFEKLYLEYEKNGAYSRQCKARDIHKKMYQIEVETGMPFIMNIDNTNRKNMQSNIGAIWQFNLCVKGNTMILTSTGQTPIETLKDQKVKVWNGQEWSTVTVRQTRESSPLVKVSLSNGVEIECTPDHRFSITNIGRKIPSNKSSRSKEVEAKDLKPGMTLCKYSLPLDVVHPEQEMKYAYTHGFFCGDGTTYWNYSHTKRYPKLYLYGEKKQLLKYIEYTSYTDNEKCDRYDVVLPKDLQSKFTVPHQYSLESKLTWLAGYLDADGIVVRCNKTDGLQVSSINKEFLLEIRLMLQTMGADSKVVSGMPAQKTLMPDGRGGKKYYNTKQTWRLIICYGSVQVLVDKGFSPKRLVLRGNNVKPQNKEKYIKVESVTECEGEFPTYCFTEPKRHMGMFNGVCTPQCQEIAQHTSDTEIASCTLASLCYPAHVRTTPKGKKKVDWNPLAHTTRVVMRALNQIIDRTYYPDELPKIKYTNIKNRPVGLGVQGLADLFAILNLIWTDPKARRINYQLMENRYYWSIMQSVELARMYGPYPAYAGSPYSKGLLHTDLCDAEGKAKDHPEWSRLTPDKWWRLKRDVRIVGVRLSLHCANMPTATTAYMIGNTESHEPIAHLIFTRKLLSGKFVHINKYLYKDISEHCPELWTESFVTNIIQSGGSIQHLSLPANPQLEAHLKAKYATVFELPQSLILDFAIDTVRFIDQSSSLNAHFANPTHQDKYSWDIKAWEGGLKTGCYYTRILPATNAINFAVGAKLGGDENNADHQKGRMIAREKCSEDVCTSCSA
jgi:ribonucleoside-diphosphate reductase alpha chain